MLRGLVADEFVNRALRTCLARSARCFARCVAAAVKADAGNGQRKNNDNSKDNA
jgi:hypothetical protein